MKNVIFVPGFSNSFERWLFNEPLESFLRRGLSLPKLAEIRAEGHGKIRCFYINDDRGSIIKNIVPGQTMCVFSVRSTGKVVALGSISFFIHSREMAAALWPDKSADDCANIVFFSGVLSPTSLSRVLNKSRKISYPVPLSEEPALLDAEKIVDQYGSIQKFIDFLLCKYKEIDNAASNDFIMNYEELSSPEIELPSEGITNTDFNISGTNKKQEIIVNEPEQQSIIEEFEEAEEKERSKLKEEEAALSPAERMERQLDRWQSELINLDRRNRLLYYKPYKASTVEFIEPLASTIVDSILSRANSSAKIIRTPEDRLDPLFGRQLAHSEIRATTLKQEDLKKILHNLERKANQIWLDRGIWVLYLGIGLLEWRETENDADLPIQTPILMFPVDLSHENSNTTFSICKTDGDVALNPALIAKMKHDFGLDLELPEDMDESDVASIFNYIRAKVRNRTDWIIKDEAVLATFSFHKDAMYKDLEANRNRIKNHSIIESIVLGDQAGHDFNFDEIDPDKLDEVAEPEEMNTILDADSSQRQAILAAREGKSFVLDGPPGTGKSQTIANIIAELIAKGKSVLFVSEKAAALDVVNKRLQAANLGDYVLELHSHTATRKELARVLGEALSRPGNTQSSLSLDKLALLRQWRSDLTEWSSAVNEMRPALGLSIIEAIGLVSKNHDLPDVPPASVNPEIIRDQTRLEVKEAARSLAHSWVLVERKDTFIWDRPKLDHFDTSNRQSILEALKALLSSIETTIKYSSLLAEDFSIPNPQLLDELAKLLDLEILLDTRPIISSELLASGDLDIIQSLLAHKKAEAKILIESREAVKDLVGDYWRDLSPTTKAKIEAEYNLIRSCAFHWLLEEDSTCQSLQKHSAYFKRSLAWIKNLIKATSDISKVFSDSEYSWTLNDAKALSILGKDCLAVERPEREWIDPNKIDSLKKLYQEFSGILTEYNSLLKQIEKIFNKEVIALELDTIASRYKNEYRKYKYIKLQYWKDQKTLKPFCREKRLKWRNRDAVQAANSLKILDGILTQREKDFSQAFGKYWNRENTDLVALGKAIDRAEGSIVWISKGFELRSLRTFLSSENSEFHPVLSEAVEMIDDEILSINTLSKSVYPERLSTISEIPLNTLEEMYPMLEASYNQLFNLFETVEKKYPVINTLHLLLEFAEKREDINLKEIEFSQAHQELSSYFSSDYQDETSDWDKLERSISWSVNAREIIGPLLNLDFTNQFMIAPSRTEKFRAVLNSFNNNLLKVKEIIYSNSKLGRRLESTIKISSLFSLVSEMSEHVDEIPETIRFYQAWEKLLILGLKNALYKASEWSIPSERLENYLDAAILIPWIDYCLDTDERLRNKTAAERDHIVADFVELDQGYTKKVSSRIIQVLDARRPKSLTGQWQILKHQSGLTRRHKPIKQLMQETDPAIKILKPCFMMSPLSVSQFLPSEMLFDAVIFDEASQVKPSDAVTCIYRGSQLIVAGDPRQLPPTSFFEMSLDDGDDYEDTQELEYWESILDMCINNASLKEMHLNWHYRSKHEDLIAFSNYSFYGGRLITFPGSLNTSDVVGVEFFYVKDGIYRRSATRDNMKEAAQLVSRVLYHIEHSPDLSMGIVALSESQAVTIERVLEMKLAERPDLASRVRKDRLSGLFVKNLETVQGDERDIIFMSIGYGHDENNKFTQNFGPMNQKVGWRRLNVAITRARQRVEIFASILPSEITAEKKESSIYFLKKYLEYAQSTENRLAKISEQPSSNDHDRESPFEDSVAKAIEAMGYRCIPQVGCSKYRIDLVVCHPDNVSRHVLAVECDGAMYHSAKVARDRDRLRKQVLVDLGWKVHRIWSTSWYRQRKEQEKLLEQVIKYSIKAYDARSIPSIIINEPTSTITQEETVLDTLTDTFVPLRQEPVYPELPNILTSDSLSQYLFDQGFSVSNKRRLGGSIWVFQTEALFYPMSLHLRKKGIHTKYYSEGRGTHPEPQWEIDPEKRLK